MTKVIIHATVTLDGFMADTEGTMDWAADVAVAEEDEALANKVMEKVGAVVSGTSKTRTVEDETPYGDSLKIPVYLMTHEPHEPIEKDGRTYTFVVNDIAQAVEAAKAAAGDKNVSLLGGSISRQCLKLDLVDEIQLHVVPILLGDGISLFGGLGERIKLERMDTSAYASETHLRYRVIK